MWRDVLDEKWVSDMSMDGVVNRYLVLALQTCPGPVDKTVAKCAALAKVSICFGFVRLTLFDLVVFRRMMASDYPH